MSDEDVIVEIASVGAQGDGVGADGAFVPFTLPGERVRAHVDGDRGEALEVLRQSLERVAPPCPHFGVCGGCALQHWASAPTLAWKVGRIEQALARAGFSPRLLAPFAAPLGSRRRLALHARRIDGRAAIGFKARRSWALTPIETCVIATPALVRALPGLRALAEPFLVGRKSAPTLHATASETGIDVDVTGVDGGGARLDASARARIADVAASADFARVSLAGEALYTSRPPITRMGGIPVELPPGGFLQAVAAAQDAMAAFAVSEAGGARRIADLYCGAGAFALPLAAGASVRAADRSGAAIAALGRAAAQGGLTVSSEARDLVRRPVLAAELARIDLVVIDPPRAGAAAQMREIAASRLAKVISVSCDLASFVSDAGILAGAGFRLETLWPIDQFLFSPHIEMVGVFVR